MPIYDIEENDIEILDNCPLCDSSNIEIISEVVEKENKTFKVDFDSNFTKIIPREEHIIFLSTACCIECKFVFRNKRPNLPWFEKSWNIRETEDTDAVFEQAHDPEKEKQRYNRYENLSKVLEEVTTERKLLDVGCGPGTGLKAFQDRGWDVMGVEPDPVRAKVGNEVNKINIFPGKIEDFTEPDETYDVITLLHVLEHFHSPKDFLIHTIKKIKYNGYLYIEVPHLHRFINWEDSLYLEHMNNFTEKTLLDLGEKLKLVPVKRFITKTTTYGYEHFAILFKKTSKNLDYIELPDIKSNGIFVNEVVESFDESEWGESWPYIEGDYLDNVKKLYRRFPKKETEPNMVSQFDKTDKIVFVVPHINSIVKTYTPLEQMDFYNKNKVVMLG
ncbi:class I SAM-dependent methyltransferase [Candidatus Woesearchaeota archaeon]|jgi:2-polyprenyl-3-methyl-5-hydroxy-6-metoxy-1,4-benzoquinol methylase|nr:class I SAM-dependent methyltransferase [Candidatus Woesearchaeota archaeon]MBT7557417.1 class I SAM-dependent methyltransferase [Candidatus Woesearchaeota archaeon]